MVCADCGFIDYQNPRIVVGVVATWGEQILLCRRAIEPRTGFWTVPGGFLENNETAEEGAIRETVEEAGARIELQDLLGVYSLRHIAQVHLVYRARLTDGRIEAGLESLEVRLFDVDDLPWDELAFSTNTWALRDFLDCRGQDLIAPRTTPGPS